MLASAGPFGLRIDQLNDGHEEVSACLDLRRSAHREPSVR